MMGNETFCFQGRFVGFEVSRKSPFQYLRLTTEGSDYRIKLSKKLQLMLFRDLTVGDPLRVMGRQQVDRHTGEPGYKATEVIEIGEAVLGTAHQRTASSDGPNKRPARELARILVCNQSSCRKRGSEGVCSAISQALPPPGRTQSYWMYGPLQGRS
ncbi:MAG: (2Fe-2S) ferredoxin domain-containing protein [Cyanobacteria bacterium J06554_6]